MNESAKTILAVILLISAMAGLFQLIFMGIEKMGL